MLINQNLLSTKSDKDRYFSNLLNQYNLHNLFRFLMKRAFIQVPTYLVENKQFFRKKNGLGQQLSSACSGHNAPRARQGKLLTQSNIVALRGLIDQQQKNCCKDFVEIYLHSMMIFVKDVVLGFFSFQFCIFECKKNHFSHYKFSKL